jgi:hypothetical protein
MAWLWNSWEEFVKECSPVGISRGTFKLGYSNTQLKSARHLLESFDKLVNASGELKALGFKGTNYPYPRYDAASIGKVHHQVTQAIYAGEELLAYHKRLAQSDAAYGFLHSNELLEHWDRYAGGRRIIHEVQQLVDDIGELAAGYQRLEHEDERLLLSGLDLPKALEEDFRLSRNLFSVGFDEVGLFIAARGLEKVLREIARIRKIFLVTGAKTQPASAADLHDLIETMSRVCWKVKGTPLITKETKTLLQHIRTVRNSGAHSGRQDTETENLRDTASMIARSANRLWGSVASSRARLVPTTVQRNWP